MPQFTPWNVPSPFPNILFDPSKVDESLARQQSELGTLDINRQRLGLEREKIAQQQAGGDALIRSLTGPPTGDSGGSGGGSFLSALANIESGDQNIVSGVDKDSKGLTLAQGGNPAEISQGHFQIQTATWRDFAKQAGVDTNQYPTAMSAPREIQARVASVIPFSRFGPRTQQLMRQQFGDIDVNQTVGTLAGLGPRVAPAAAGGVRPPVVAAPVAPPPVLNPNAGPRVANLPGNAPPVASPWAVLTNPNAPPAAPATVPPPVTTGQADPASMAAVKQASVALLNMPEADAAAAYPGVVRELQARGLAMNAPPEYPGHAALQAIVGGGEPTAPAVEPSRIAMRLGGTDTAGPAAGTDTLPPIDQPHRLYQTGLAGVQISAPGNPLAGPLMAPAAPTAPPGASPTAPAQPGTSTRPPPLQPPPAPTRVIPLEPVLPSGLTATQVQLAAAMVRSGAPTADVAAHVEQWRQANISGRQQAATQAALEAQQNYDRQRQYRQDQIEAEKTQYQRQQDAIKNQREEVTAKNAGLPAGYRMRDDGTAYRIDGLPPDPAVAEAAKAAFEAEQRKQPFQGTGTNEQDRNILIAGTKSGQFDTPEYASAYTNFGKPQYNAGDGSWVKPNMNAYAKPTFKPPGATEVPDYTSQETPVPTILNMEQGKAAGFADRIRQALPVISDTSDAAMNRWQIMLGKAPLLGNTFVSPEFQLHQQSERNFINAVLRRESGASILPDEFAQARQQYIPQPGDAPEVLAQKAQNRAAILAGMTREAGPGYKPAATAQTTTAPAEVLAAARDAISKGAPRDAVIKRLRDNGINPAGL